MADAPRLGQLLERVHARPPRRARRTAPRSTSRTRTPRTPQFFTVPEPKAPKFNDRTWGLPQLVHQIGLPAPGDADTAIAAFLPRLRERYGEHVTEESIKDSFVRWRQLANRGLLNARDSALSFTVGARPRAQIPPGDDRNFFDLDDDRISTDDIQALLDGLRHNGAVIGVDHWGPAGRDRALVCVLTRSSGRSVAPDDFFAVRPRTRYDGTKERAYHGPNRQLDLVPIELPKEDADLNWLVFLFAHECGHAFGLGDEYGERGAKKGGLFDRADDTDTAEHRSVPEPARAGHAAEGGRAERNRRQPREVGVVAPRLARRRGHRAARRRPATSCGSRYAPAPTSSRSANACVCVRCSCAATPTTRSSTSTRSAAGR